MEKSKSELREQSIRRVMKKTGWTYDFTVEQIEDARKRLGVSYKEYLKHDLFSLSAEEQKQKYEEVVLQMKHKAKEKQDRIIVRVMDATGWSYDVTNNKIKEAQERTGCTYTEYMLYKFYELDEMEQAEVFTIYESKKITAKYNVDKKFVNVLYNKELSNNYFSEYLIRPWCVNTKISFEEFQKKFADSKRIFYKPCISHHGDGAKSFEINNGNIKEVFSKLVSYPKGVVERYICQHSKMNALAPSAVNTVRVVSISSNTQPVMPGGTNIDIPYVSLKMGGANSVVDNLAGGGLVAAVDLKTGKLITDAVDEEGNVYSRHPATGMIIKGFDIPFFAETLKLVLDAYEKKRFEGYLGWDIAITEDGPEVVEVNTVPGVILFQLPYVAEKKGMKHVMVKYLS